MKGDQFCSQELDVYHHPSSGPFSRVRQPFNPKSSPSNMYVYIHFSPQTMNAARNVQLEDKTRRRLTLDTDKNNAHLSAAQCRIVRLLCSALLYGRMRS